MASRAEVIRACKERALLELPSSPQNAILSMMHELKGFPETRELAEMMSLPALAACLNPTKESAKNFIEGFTEV